MKKHIKFSELPFYLQNQLILDESIRRRMKFNPDLLLIQAFVFSEYHLPSGVDSEDKFIYWRMVDNGEFGKAEQFLYIQLSNEI